MILLIIIFVFISVLLGGTAFRYYCKFKNAEYLSKAGWRCTYIGEHMHSDWRAPDENHSRQFPEALKRQAYLDEITKLNLPKNEFHSLNKYQAEQWK